MKTIILFLALAWLAVFLLANEAFGEHRGENPVLLSTMNVCATPEVVRFMILEPDPAVVNKMWELAHKHGYSRGGCNEFERVNVVLHKVVEELVWASDDEETPMLIIHISDAYGRLGYFWAVKSDIEDLLFSIEL